MANYYTSSQLIDSIKRRAMLPSNQLTFVTDDFLALATEEMMIGLVPKIMELHQDYFMREELVALESGVSSYDIPYRAVGNKLRELSFIDLNDNVLQMTRIEKEDLPFYQNSSASVSATYVRYYYIENNQINIVPKLSQSVSGSLAFTYYIRPSKLVTESRAATITAIDTSTGEITVEGLPRHFNLDIQYDFVMAHTPHKIRSLDLDPVSINSSVKTITFSASDLPSGLVVGDYVMQAEETVVPQIPADLHMVLAQRVACRCLEALGDTQGLQNANLKLQEMEMRLNNLIDNRVEGSPQKVVAHNGLLRNMLSRRIGRGRF